MHTCFVLGSRRDSTHVRYRALLELLHVLQAASSPPTPKLGHSGASASLPPPPAFATLPFNDDPPPRPPATHEPPPKPTAATMPAAQPAGQSSDAVAMEAPVSHGAAEDAPSPTTLPLVMDAQSSLQLLPLGGAATTAVSTLAAAQPGASAVSTVAAAQPSSDAMSTVDAAAEPAQKLVLRSPEGPPPPPSGPRRTEHGEWGERGGDGHDADSDAKLLTGCLYMLLFGVSMTALLLFVYEIFYRMFRDGLRSTPVLDSVDAQQVSIPHTLICALGEALARRRYSTSWPSSVAIQCMGGLTCCCVEGLCSAF